MIKKYFYLFRLFFEFLEIFLLKLIFLVYCRIKNLKEILVLFKFWNNEVRNEILEDD